MRCCTGITPAHAGKSSSLFRNWRCTRDHPRSRGEKWVLLVRPDLGQGSPPLTRGKDRGGNGFDGFVGITPAHAGKSPSAWTTAGFWRDHPRSRGEKVFHGASSFRRGGSPPLTRGKDIAILNANMDKRITPAHAGKSYVCWRLLACAGDHPRSRGEKEHPAEVGRLCGGSPPLTRGKDIHGVVVQVDVGITPAHAGKS